MYCDGGIVGKSCDTGLMQCEKVVRRDPSHFVAVILNPIQQVILLQLLFMRPEPFSPTFLSN